MIQREIEIFEKHQDSLYKLLVISIPDKILFEHFAQYTKDDPNLIYSYYIKEGDVEFFKGYTSCQFDFEKYDYILTCSNYCL